MENTVFSLVQLASKKAKIGECNTQNGSDTKSSVNITGTSSSAVDEVTGKNANHLMSFKIGSSLQLLPEEMWELVLNHLESPQDILNCLKAFPDLDKLFHSKKPNWLFDLILPHIVTKHLVRKQKHRNDEYYFLRSQEFYKLRLVSKRWKYAVEKSIENHPDFSSQSQTASNIEKVVTENHFSYFPIQKFHFGATIFHTPNHIEGFMENMKDYNGNPFPGKFVFLKAYDDNEDLEILLPIVPNLERLTQKFGQYINILEFEFYTDYQCNLEIFKGILNILGNVPNVKSLTIRAELDTPEDETTNDFFGQLDSQQLFPELKFLTTFNWYVRLAENSTWNTRMLYTYIELENCLTKLSIKPVYFDPEMGQSLTRLTELHILMESGNEDDINSIRNVLSCFPGGQIQKFGVDYYPLIYRETEIYVTRILQILDEFEVKTIDFDRCDLKERPNIGAEFICLKNTYLSITSVYLNDNLQLSYKFLKQLPNLKFLHVFVSAFVRYHFDLENTSEQKLFANSLRRYFAQADCDACDPGKKVVIPDHFSIWNELPNLERLCVSVNSIINILDVQFFREHGNIPFSGYRP